LIAYLAEVGAVGPCSARQLGGRARLANEELKVLESYLVSFSLHAKQFSRYLAR